LFNLCLPAIFSLAPYTTQDLQARAGLGIEDNSQEVPPKNQEIAQEIQDWVEERALGAQEEALGDQWARAALTDPVYEAARTAVKTGQRKFPPTLGLKVSLSECTINGEGFLIYRGRKWVPDDPFLRTRLISGIHESPAAGHPGREATYCYLARDYFWPGMSSNIRQYVSNCDICGRTKVRRELKQGFLHPLPLPDRIWKEISMDFITDLPLSDSCRYLMVVTCRLSKGIILIPLPNLETATVARAFIKHVVAYHWLPDYAVSDRGGQFIGDFWTTMCGMLGIKRRLSTTDHPQTDGSTERMNSTIEAYLRAYIRWDQSDWAFHTDVAQIAINGRVAASTGVAPFFLQHGYNVDPIQPDEDWVDKVKNQDSSPPDKAAKKMVEKFVEVLNYVQARMAEAQQAQENQANKKRRQSPILRVGDRVWLKYGRTLSNGRPNRKLDWKAALFRVEEVISPFNVRLDTPGDIFPIFHVDRLVLHPRNPLPGQQTNDSQPEALVEDKDGNLEWEIEDIVGERVKRVGRGQRKEYLVKWVGYAMCSWERESFLEEAEALDRWLEFSEGSRDGNGNVQHNLRRGVPTEPR
jgi:hypothetical protein